MSVAGVLAGRTGANASARSSRIRAHTASARLQHSRAVAACAIAKQLDDLSHYAAQRQRCRDAGGSS